MAVSVLAWTPWGLPAVALIGAAVAVGVVSLVAWLLHKRAWEAVGQMLRPLASLGKALLPLALPTLMIVAFATRAVSLFLQFFAGVALAGLFWLFFRGEGEVGLELARVREIATRTKAALAPGSRRSSLVRTGVPSLVIGGIGALVVLLVAGFGGQFSSWASEAGFSGWLEWFALVLLAIAFPYRLIGYATNWLRAAAAILLALLVAQVLFAAGVLRGDHYLRSAHLDLGAASVGFLIGFFGVLFAEAVVVKLPYPKPGPFHRAQRAWGFIATVVATGLLGLALGVASVQTTSGADRLGHFTAALKPTLLKTGGGTDAQLAWTFAPLLHIEHNEHYGPTGVSSFLKLAKETGTGAPGQIRTVTLATLPSKCPDGSHTACGTLKCETCSDTYTKWPPEQGESSFLRQGVLYARVAHRSSEPNVFSGGYDPFPDLKTLIQYWIFYLYDRWQAETVVGQLTQEHQGDWEFVSVGLGAQNQPRFIALSAHCGGQWVKWTATLPTAFAHVAKGKVVYTDHNTGHGDQASHPIVAVARGSHANYSDDSSHRPPDWGSCKKLPTSALTAISYASNVRDLTADNPGSGWFVYPRKVVVVKTTNGLPGPPFDYPGAWGDHESITFSYHSPLDTGSGPKSPPLQGASWDKPIKLFFCDPYWHGSEDTSRGCSGKA